MQALLAEAEARADEDRRTRAAIERRNRALTLVSQAERRLRDAALELGPYGAERQQRAVEMAMRDLQDLLEQDDLQELELGVALSGGSVRPTDVSPLNAVLRPASGHSQHPRFFEGRTVCG